MEDQKVIITEEEKNFAMPSETLTKRKRKKTNYKKINNQNRQKLIEMVSVEEA